MRRPCTVPSGAPPEDDDRLRDPRGPLAGALVARAGADVMKRIAAPMAGRGVTSDLELVVTELRACSGGRSGCQASADRLRDWAMRRLLAAITAFLLLSGAAAPGIGDCCQRARHACCEKAGTSDSPQAMHSPPCCASSTLSRLATAAAVETKTQRPTGILANAANFVLTVPHEPYLQRTITPATWVLQRALGPPLRLRI